MYSWGNNEKGQLGLGPNIPNTVRRPVLNTHMQNVSKLSAGNEHSMALTKNSELYVWGSADVTGMDDTENRTIPQIHNFFKHLKISQIASGGLHAVILTKVGEIYTWGSTEGG